MDHAFWIKAWEEGRTAFHQNSPSPFLVKYAAKLNIKDHAHVLLPLCGKTLDLLYFKELGLKVTGIELSDLAISQFKQEHPRTYEIKKHDSFEIHKHNELEIWKGDFFDFNPSCTSKIDFVFDRAAMVALPIELRRDYAKALSQFIETGATLMLVTFEYPQDKIDGPPFCVSREEVRSLYADYKIEIIESKFMPPGEKFINAGISEVEVLCYAIKK